MNSLKTNNLDLVSVIIVNWNGKKWLNNCISSLNKQTYKNIEIIMVDNASTDSSVEYVEKKFPKVVIIKNKTNLGLPKANNTGVKCCHGKYVLLINNDTWVEKDFIENLLEFYSTKKYDVIAPVEKRYEKKLAFEYITSVDPTGSPVYLPISKINKLFYLSVCFFCTKKIYLDTLGLDENYFMYYEDVDWFWRLSLLGKNFSYAKNIFVYHAGSGSTQKGVKYNTFLWRNQNTLQTLIKNYSLLMLAIVLPLYIIQNFFEIIFFLLILKPSISYSYIQGWAFNLINLKRTLVKRRWIQKNRVVGDKEILSKMSFIPGKFMMLKNHMYFPNEK